MGKAGVDTAPGRRLTRWRQVPSGRLVAPVACALYEVFFLTRYISILPDGPPTPTALLALLCITPTSTIGVFFRYRAPFAIVVLESLLTLCSEITFLTIVPLCMAVFAVIAKARPVKGLVGGALAFVAVLPEAIAGGFAGNAIIRSCLLTVAVVGGLVSRMQRAKREATQEIEREHAARRRAERRSRIAGELHDSVGHDLTAIIALAEGLCESDDEDARRVSALIGKLARSGLADTRSAVRAISASIDADPAGSSAPSRGDDLHDLDELRACMDDIRATGVAAVLTTSGKHPSDEGQDDLCFRIAREAITNSIRHGRSVTRVSVALDFDDEGSCTLTVRDDGCHPKAPARAGFGLSRLQDEVEHVGGTWRAGPARDRGWEVVATVLRFGRRDTGQGDFDA